jgi:hypothetical protein
MSSLRVPQQCDANAGCGLERDCRGWNGFAFQRDLPDTEYRQSSSGAVVIVPHCPFQEIEHTAHREQFERQTDAVELRSYRLDASGMNKIVRSTSPTVCSIKSSNVHVRRLAIVAAVLPNIS